MDPNTYQSMGGLNRLPQTLREFGERQNRLNVQLREENASLSRQIEVLAGQLGEVLERIAALEAALERVDALEAEQEGNSKRFRRCAADLSMLENEVGRLKVTAKLNTNAIDRLARKE